MNIFLTGSTGFLGGEILVKLATRTEVSKIYCLVRGNNAGDGALTRIKQIFALHDDRFDERKIIPVEGNLTDENLAEHLSANPLLKDINVVIHSAANTSFSPIYNDLIEKVNINGLNQLLHWSRSLKHLDTFTYIGTATICGKDIKDRVVYESESPDLKARHLVKYTYTKMMGEIALRNALPEKKILIVRPSIIMGDSRPIFPRSPVILWTLATANLIRLLPMRPDTALDVIPVDYTADAICRLLFAKRKYDTYHISSGTASISSPYKLSKAIENSFPDRPEFKFINKNLMNPIKQWAKKKADTKNLLGEYAEYLQHWSHVFEDPGKLRILLAGMEPYFEFLELGQTFDNSRLLEDTNIGPPPPAHEYIKKSIRYLEKIDVFEAALDP